MMGLMDKFADPALIDSLSFGEKMAGSAITMLMGMGITFVILCLLWAFIVIMGRVMDGAGKRDKAQISAQAAAAPPAAAEPAASAKSDDEVIAAVIAAAVLAYQDSGGTGNLVVRRISRISGEATLWTNAAREECIESRRF